MYEELLTASKSVWQNRKRHEGSVEPFNQSIEQRSKGCTKEKSIKGNLNLFATSKRWEVV